MLSNLSGVFKRFDTIMLLIVCAFVAASGGMLDFQTAHAAVGDLSSHLPMAGMGFALAMGSLAPFPVTPELTAISVAYKNKTFIADEVLPRVPVGVESFKYRKFALADGFTIPNTLVGRTGSPNELQFGFTEATASTADYGLDDPIPQKDIDNAPAGYDPVGHAVESLSNIILLDREKRAADLVFNTNSYATANKLAISVSTSKFGDFTNSDPIKTIMDALDACTIRPNILVFGRVPDARTSPISLRLSRFSSGNRLSIRRTVDNPWCSRVCGETSSP